MLINADFTRAAIVGPAQYQWLPSPQAGVERVMLDRIGGEVARATSLVRYAPGSSFPAHGHPGGEEILVLSGTFSDETGAYPAGWYLRHPPGSRHAPASAEGALIFVKLGQIRAGDDRTVRIDTSDPARWTGAAGRHVCELFAEGTEEVTLQRLAAGTPLFRAPVDGVELLVIAGSLLRGSGELVEGTWLRLPLAIASDTVAGAGGATIYLKTGHLGRIGDPDRHGQATNWKDYPA